jgi:predicted phage-related endonuclease
MLTKEQLLERRKGIGASDAKKIVGGLWYDLWLDKTGRKEPDAVLSPWDSSVRHALEPLVMDDYAERVGYPIGRRGEAVIHPELSFLRCTLDGFDPHFGPVDAKVLNIWTPDPVQWCIDAYSEQMQHQMACTGATKGALHVSLGMARPNIISFERDDFFLQEYIDLCREFWGFVERDEEPTAGRVLEMTPIPPEKMSKKDMTGNNAFAAAAFLWRTNVQQAKVLEKAAATLKELVPADAREARGYGIIISRTGRGLSIKKETK